METNTLNETTPNQAPEQNSVKIYKKRVGRNGSGWKKNKTKYIADANLRRAKEISKVNTLSKNVKESGVLTKMPLCFFSYTTHDRKITAECSVKGLEAFINDPVVIEKFKKAVLAIQIDEDNLSVEEEDCEKEGVDFFDFPLSFPSQNAIKKRKLVNDLVKFDSGCSSKRMKWSDDIKPSWWPLDVDFISPDTKDNRPTVQTLDKILHAFHDDQVENKMDLMSEEDMPNASTIESLTDWSKLQLKTWRILMDWLRNRWQEPVLCLATQKISLRNRSIVADKGFSGREPVFHPDLAKCLSWLMFGTVDREELVIRIAIIASVYCLKNFSERMTQGNSDHSASHYKRLFKSDSMASLQQKLVDDSLAHKLGQDKTRQDKTRQDKTRQDKTRQDKTRQDKTRQDKNITRHDMT
uniref:Uncharacterized protein n=1 Tax=Clytia hemisphaerica TaxID=252671 RepID=A0A7M6DQE4_9CNID